MKIFLKLSVITFALIYSSILSATVIPPLMIDFRSSDWLGAYGVNSFTVGAVTAKAVSTDEPNGKLYRDGVDGLGVLPNPKKPDQCGYEIDEIDSCEKLKVTFDEGQFLISDVWLTDLFKAPDGDDEVNGEYGKLRYKAYGDTRWTNIDFWGVNSDQANGEQMINLGEELNLEIIEFFVPKYEDGSFRTSDEFSVAGFTGVSVPEPTPLVLLGLMILGLGALRKRS